MKAFTVGHGRAPPITLPSRKPSHPRALALRLTYASWTTAVQFTLCDIPLNPTSIDTLSPYSAVYKQCVLYDRRYNSFVLSFIVIVIVGKTSTNQCQGVHTTVHMVAQVAEFTPANQSNTFPLVLTFARKRMLHIRGQRQHARLSAP